jgi:hypothetical protein
VVTQGGCRGLFGPILLRGKPVARKATKTLQCVLLSWRSGGAVVPCLDAETLLISDLSGEDHKPRDATLMRRSMPC